MDRVFLLWCRGVLTLNEAISFFVDNGYTNTVEYAILKQAKLKSDRIEGKRMYLANK